ncbi:hypothetical protein Q8A73_001684 [Channa argus]|nr:hypothetical protein Q8A73_001684 [Channa argus]
MNKEEGQKEVMEGEIEMKGGRVVGTRKKKGGMHVILTRNAIIACKNERGGGGKGEHSYSEGSISISNSGGAGKQELAASPRRQHRLAGPIGELSRLQPPPPSLTGLKGGSEIPLPCAIFPTDRRRYGLPVKRRWWRGEAGVRAVGGGWGEKTVELQEGEGEAENCNREPKRFHLHHRYYYHS